jgi:origin recognition complex subunit 5
MLISSYIASHTDKANDVRLFSQTNTKRKLMKQDSSTAKVSDQFKGPRVFEAERMFAIFEVISGIQLDYNVELFIQLASLIQEGFLKKMSMDGTLDSPKLKCNVTFEIIQKMAALLSIDLTHYLA